MSRRSRRTTAMVAAERRHHRSQARANILGRRESVADGVVRPDQPWVTGVCELARAATSDGRKVVSRSNTGLADGGGRRGAGVRRHTADRTRSPTVEVVRDIFGLDTWCWWAIAA